MYTMEDSTYTTYTMEDPTYIDVDGCVYSYTPPSSICSLRRFKIAQSARQRMLYAHWQAKDDKSEWFELWQRERESFWITLAYSIPDRFK